MWLCECITPLLLEIFFSGLLHLSAGHNPSKNPISGSSLHWLSGSLLQFI
jgi:hypothetical protein